MAKRWSDLLDLMRCQWFSRRWVIQELALAQTATVHCASQCTSWETFADAIGLFALNYDEVRALFRQGPDGSIYDNYKSFDQLEPLGAKKMVDAITNVFRESTDGKMIDPVSDLETLLQHKDLEDLFVVQPPKPDYEKDLLEGYSDFLEWATYSSNSVDIICRSWAMPERERLRGGKYQTGSIQLPSWIQTISKSTWGTQEQGFNGRINGESFVGKPGQSPYNASYGKPPTVQFGPRKRLPARVQERIAATSDLDEPLLQVPPGDDVKERRKVFQVKGLELDTIDWVSCPVSAGVINNECLVKGGWDNSTTPIAKVPDKLWRTLVADRTEEGGKIPPHYRRAALHCMGLLDNNGNIRTEALLKPFHEEQPRIVVEYLKRVQAVTWNRKFIEGTRMHDGSGRPFGLGPPDTQKGDKICILFGCSVPCILRPGSMVGNNQVYNFIGEAYVYGIMDGEAVAMMEPSQLQMETVNFLVV
ncbi:hypothetical protein F4778DRAFT_789512 [Xylariomycetidae sp. FL2044]|nr:hypothetical protein F4778DRAFT_789512 [Xylariomycetidae sp. FL2044]